MDQFSNSLTRQIVNLGGGFWHFLSACVTAFVSDLAGSAADASTCRTMILVKDGLTEVYGQSKMGVRDLRARFGSGPAEITAELRAKLKGSATKSVLLRVDSARAVVKKIPLPVAALEVMPAIVRNKVESLAPWPLHEVMWGYRVPVPSHSGHVDVEVGIVGRKTVNDLLAAIRGAGARVTHLDISAAADEVSGIGIDFLGPSRAGAARRIVAGVMSLAGIVSVMAASYGIYLAFSTWGEMAVVDRRAADIHEVLLNGRGAGEVNARLSLANKLYERKKDTPPVINILNTLTKVVPDSSWLNSIDYGGNQLTISGRGTEIARVIENLETSDIFADVNFASATQRDADLQADIFSISAAIQTQGQTQ